MGELVDVTDDLKRFPGATERRCNELEQRFGKIRSDEMIGERGTQAPRMRRLRQVTVIGNTQ